MLLQWKWQADEQERNFFVTNTFDVPIEDTLQALPKFQSDKMAGPAQWTTIKCKTNKILHNNTKQAKSETLELPYPYCMFINM